MKSSSTLNLEIKIADLIRKHRPVMAKCPAGHRIVVEVNFRFVPTDMVILLRERKLPKLIVSQEEFTDEHFQAILELPLSERDMRFVRFFQTRRNRPCIPNEWVKEGFAEHGRLQSVNTMCKRAGLWLRLHGETPCSWWPDQKHKFVIMEEEK